AHNFIEMGIEMNIAESERELMDVFCRGLTDHHLIKELSLYIDKYYGLKDRSVADCFNRFTEFMELEDLNSFTLASRYNTQMNYKHGIEIDISKCSDIIEKAREIVQEDFEDFMEFCTDKVKAMLQEEHS
ncbi:MAG: hypothetical protein GX301_13100, partial [Gracilibacteraceae bacterium]|nr:hypothetical protein [Gracilibacteraceae bacterium]